MAQYNTHSVGSSIFISDCLCLTTDHLLGLLHTMLEETVVEYSSIMDVHVYLLICSRDYKTKTTGPHTFITLLYSGTFYGINAPLIAHY